MNREEAKEMFRKDKDAYGKPKAIMHKIDQIFDEFEKCSIKNCSTCKNWEQNTFYDYPGAINDGKCTGLTSKVQITLQTGWEGGYVDYIETESDFGCTLHENEENVS